MIHLSLSEMQSLSKQAIRGSGFSWGIAEEIAWQVCRLEHLRLPAFTELSKWLDWHLRNPNFDLKKHQNCPQRTKRVKMGMFFGICLLDEGFQKLKEEDLILNGVLAPLFLIPALQYFAQVQVVKFLVHWQDCDFEILSEHLYQSGNNISPKKPIKVVIKTVNDYHNQSNCCNFTHQNNLIECGLPTAVSKKVHQRMCTLASQICVPSDEYSENDAG